jgi:hypothetical protein
MVSELKITWDGTVPGLSEHRISIDAFGNALPLLLIALRRIAHQMVSEATEGDRMPRGRLANAAKNLDIEIGSVKQNSSGVDALITFRNPPPQIDMFATLAERATVGLLDAIEMESSGKPANASVRNYLRALPEGMNRQLYEFFEDGTIRKRAEVGKLILAELPPDLPLLRTIEANIIGVGFEPGRNEVRVRTDTNPFMTLAAASEDVDKSLQMRHEKVRAILVEAKKSRLIGIRRASDPKFQFNAETARKHIFEKWGNVLKALAK